MFQFIFVLFVYMLTECGGDEMLSIVEHGFFGQTKKRLQETVGEAGMPKRTLLFQKRSHVG